MNLDSAFVLIELERVMMGGGQGFGWSVVEGKGLTSDSSLHDGKAADIGGVAVFHFVLEVEGVVLFGFGIRNAVQDFGGVAVLSRRIYRSQTNRREPPIYSARMFLPMYSRKFILQTV